MNFKKKMQRGFVFALSYAITICWSMAQNITVRLLDKENASAIVGATYQHGSQNGISDINGDISFEHKDGLPMTFSHITYGKWELDHREVSTMVVNQVLYRQSTIVNLYPVTVIALRVNKKHMETVKLEYQDRLAHDGASILNQNPALSSIRKGGNYGFDPVFRGFKYDQLNIVLNGAQSATAACPNRMDPPTSQMAPNMVDRIEILKGPHALRYGTGFGATINFVPIRPKYTEENDIYGRVSSGYEGNGSVVRNEGQLGFSGKKHDIALFGSWSQGNDYSAGNGQIIPSDFNRGSFGANIGFKLSQKNQLRVSATYNLARDADFAALAMDLRKDDTWLFNARHDITFDKNHLTSWNTTVFGSFVDHLMDNLLKPLNPRMLNAKTEATTSNYGGRTEGIWNFENANLFAGADFRREGAEGIRTREFLMGPNANNSFFDNAWQNGHIAKGSLFGEYQFRAGSTQFVVSTRLEVNTSDIDEPSSEFLEVNAESKASQFNPSVSFGASQKLNDDLSLGVWLGRAQRSASLTERFINYFPVGQDPFELVGNPQLRPEVNNQLDLSFRWNRKTSRWGVDVFAGYLQDFISSYIDSDLSTRLPMSPGVRRFVNIDNAFKTGFELNWTQQLYLGVQHQLGIAYTHAQDLQRDEPLPEIAPLDFRYTLTGNYIDDKLRPEISFRHSLEQSRTSTEYGETTTPSFTILDVKLAYQFNKSARLMVGMNNILDENYYEHLVRSVRGNNQPIYAPGRNAFASINFLF